ncbi:MAG: hypothetical protein JWO32_2594 [Bacteroidetes bacterium]|nr:hypothetical protein [Bacteroidota bacterium]
MKKLICISLIAIAVLSGCKGSSFITQRYTGFSNASHTKKGEDVKVNTKQKYSIQIVHRESKPVEASEPEPVFCSNSSSVKESMLKVKPHSLTSQDVNSKFSCNSISKAKVESDNTINKKSEFKTKKTFKEKVQSAKGAISTTLKIVLFSVILAIVVGIIILVVLLG